MSHENQSHHRVRPSMTGPMNHSPDMTNRLSVTPPAGFSHKQGPLAPSRGEAVSLQIQIWKSHNKRTFICCLVTMLSYSTVEYRWIIHVFTLCIRHQLIQGSILHHFQTSYQGLITFTYLCKVEMSQNFTALQ